MSQAAAVRPPITTVQAAAPASLQSTLDAAGRAETRPLPIQPYLCPRPTTPAGASAVQSRSPASPLTQERRPSSTSYPAGPSSTSTAGSHLRDEARRSIRGCPAMTANTSSPSIIDSMTTVIDEGTSTREFFGSSSAGSFTAQIKRAIDTRLQKPNKPRSEGPVALGSARFSAPHADYATSEVSYVLPPRRQADHLMELYWFYVDPLYPFLDKARWERAYEAIFAGTRLEVDERLFVATLNIVLALSTQLVETLSPEARDKTSSGYLQRAQELQPFHLLDAGSLELVQYLLLASQFLQSTDQPHLTWMVVGSAIRNAQSLGMHLCATSADRTDTEERELIRRVWYGCVLMDR